MGFLRRDPCGFLCLIMTYGSVLYADYVVVRWIVLECPPMYESLWGTTHVILFNLIVFLLLMSHARAVFSDPGIVPFPQHPIDFSHLHDNKGKSIHDEGPPPPMEDWTICTRCEMYRPPRAHHCRICKRCIRRMDHHCPWINNCVGEWNQKYFLQFLFYVGLLAIYSVFLVVLAWYSTNSKDSSSSSDSRNKGSRTTEEMMVTQTRVLHSVILVLESILFGMFVIAIGCDQFEAIFTDETLVEQAKKSGPFRPRKPKMTLMAEVCGRGHPITWLLPCYSLPLQIEPTIDGSSIYRRTHTV